jgi:hypothetical protein
MHTALAAGGALLGSPFVPPVVHAADATSDTVPRRFVFFLFSNGLHPDHVRPKELLDTNKTDKVIDADLAAHKLPEWSAPIEAYKDRMTIIHGINGEHCNTNHGSPFGCLAGVKKGKSPSAPTIDHAISQLQSSTPLPMLGIGLSQLGTMQTSPISYSSSAAGEAKPLPLFSDPRMAYQNIFGCVAGGKSEAGFLAETAWYDQMLADSTRLRGRLAGEEAAKFDVYIHGLKQAKRQRLDLVKIKDKLSKFKPDYTDRFENPQESGDWWQAGIDVGVAALQAGVTNVLTIDAGLSGPDGMPLDTLGLQGAVQQNGEGGKPRAINSHYLGHMNQLDESVWVTTRHYSFQMLERVIKPLASTPEPSGGGSMLDNTLIVYTSDSGEVQHSTGIHWPFVLIGNLGGRFRTGRYIQYPTWGTSLNPGSGQWGKGLFQQRPEDGRTINALWATMLHAMGKPVDHFNLGGGRAGIDKLGPLEELLV